VIQVSVGGGGELQGSEADIIQGLVINTESLVTVFNKLMDREGSIVRLDNGIGYLWRGHDRESAHHSVWVLFTDLGDQKRSHSGSSSSTKRVGDLESLEAVTGLSLLTYNIEHAIYLMKVLEGRKARTISAPSV
jgi:hypothetical protein